MSKEIRDVVFVGLETRRYGGTELFAHALNGWLDGSEGRLIVNFDGGRRMSLRPQRAFTERARTLTLHVEFDRPARTARRAPKKRRAA